eukprot:c20592_g1_i1.p1 GENE.c20592_g1_i1~~c20592_g1_i1.p1  ORF type:complete len:655 (+),score=113.23 c20592_g1_i1:142-2106(+)
MNPQAVPQNSAGSSQYNYGLSQYLGGSTSQYSGVPSSQFTAGPSQYSAVGAHPATDISGEQSWGAKSFVSAENQSSGFVSYDLGSMSQPESVVPSTVGSQPTIPVAEQIGVANRVRPESRASEPKTLVSEIATSGQSESTTQPLPSMGASLISEQAQPAPAPRRTKKSRVPASVMSPTSEITAATSTYTDDSIVEQLREAMIDRNRVVVDFQTLHREMQNLENEYISFRQSVTNEKPPSDSVTNRKLKRELSLAHVQIQQLKKESDGLKAQNVTLMKEILLLRQNDPKVLEIYVQHSEAAIAAEERLTKTARSLANDLEAIKAQTRKSQREMADVMSSLVREMCATLKTHEEANHARAELAKTQAKLAGIAQTEGKSDLGVSSHAVVIDDWEWRDQLQKRLEQLEAMVQGTGHFDFAIGTDDHETESDYEWLGVSTSQTRSKSNFELTRHSSRKDEAKRAHEPQANFTQKAPALSPTALQVVEGLAKAIRSDLGSVMSHRVLIEGLLARLRTQDITLLKRTGQVMDKCRQAHMNFLQKFPEIFPIVEVQTTLAQEKRRFDTLVNNLSNTKDKRDLSGTTVREELVLCFDNTMRALFTLLAVLSNVAVSKLARVKQLEERLEAAGRSQSLSQESNALMRDIQETLEHMASAITKS